MYKPSHYNWSHIDEDTLKAEDPEYYRRWRIIQLLTYGLHGERLDKKEVMELWPDIKDQVDPYTRRTVEFLLWNKQYSLPPNLTFWNKRKTNQK